MVIQITNTKSRNLLNLAAYAFFLFGIFIFIINILLYIGTSGFIRDSLRAEGTVIELVSNGDVYYPKVSYYTLDGENIIYTESTGSDPPGFLQGEAVEIFYDKDNPRNARINSFFMLWFGNIVLTAISSVFFFVGGFILFTWIYSEYKKKWLIKNGKKIYAEFVRIEKGNSFRIVAQHNSEGKIYVFYSDEILFDPKKHIMHDFIKVYVNPKNMNDYHIDLSFLPALGQ